MPGIVGVVGGDESYNKQIFPPMHKSLLSESQYKTDTIITSHICMGRVSLGHFNPEKQPIYNEDRSLCIILDGEIYDYASFKQELYSKKHEFKMGNDAEYVLHLYEEYPDRFAGKLNGSFILAIWNEKEQELTIANDRFGTRPLYYALHDGKLFFGSEIKTILSEKKFPRKVNDEAVVDLFSFGYVLGNKTLFKGVEILPPASVLTWKKGDLLVHSYWSIKTEVVKGVDDQQHLKILNSLWLKAVSRQLAGGHKIIIPLSGGLDSRAIVAAAYKLGKTETLVGTFTYGKKDSDDRRLARRISETAKLKNYGHDLQGLNLPKYSEKIVSLSEGMCNCWATHMLSTLDDLKDSSDIILSGYLGGVLLGGFGLWAINSQKDELSMYKSLGNPANLDILEKLLSDEYYTQMKTYAKEILVPLNLPKADDVLAKVDYFNLRQRQRRLINQVNCLIRTKVEIRYPFCDNELVDYVLTIPPKLRMDYNLYKMFYSTYYPEFAEIPWQYTGVAINAGKLRIYLNRKLLAFKRKTNRIMKILGFSPIFKDTKNYAEYGEWLLEDRNWKYITDILLDNLTLSRGYFKQEYIINTLEIHKSRKENNFEIIGLLLTFELWNRLFIDQNG